MELGHYYQAYVDPAHGWFFVGVLRSLEHVAFDRTLTVETSLFEFFVPLETEQYFLDVMHYFEREHIISDLKKFPNRLAQEGAEL